MSEISTKPYLIRALYEWCNDSGYTPYLSVKVSERTQVPREHVRNGEIVLNISSRATHRLSIDNDRISFQARFSGVPRELFIPIDAVMSIYARETGQGMAFEVEDLSEALDESVAEDAPESGPDAPPSAPDPAPPPSGRPKLTRVK